MYNSVEECLRAGEVVGCESVKAASRKNDAAILFLDSVDKNNTAVEQGIVLRNTNTVVISLVNLVKKIIL